MVKKSSMSGIDLQGPSSLADSAILHHMLLFLMSPISNFQSQPPHI